MELNAEENRSAVSFQISVCLMNINRVCSVYKTHFVSTKQSLEALLLLYYPLLLQYVFWQKGRKQTRPEEEVCSPLLSFKELQKKSRKLKS